MNTGSRTLLFDRIFVPLDGSELSDRILKQVRRVLLRKDAEVVLVRVIPSNVIRDTTSSPDALDAARMHLDRVAESLRSQGANVSTEILVGEPAERLLMFCAERMPSLVAMATHGRSGVARWIRGSIAERMLRAAPFPLLLANPFALAADGEARFKRILVPLDGSKRSEEILPYVRELADLYGSEVILQTIVEIPPVAEYPEPLIVTSSDEARARLEAYRQRFEGIRVSEIVELGTPASTILERADVEKPDLIALTTHGRTGAARWAYGSVAEHVLRHAPCPLLVQRTMASPEAR
jgi:nucleotide-binding universal stress UspA family protein